MSGSRIQMSIPHNKESDRRFRDRTRAGQLLAEKLSHYANREDVAVVALPPGGVPVGYEIATALDAPFDVLVIRHLGVPENPVLVMGAVCADGTQILNHEVIRWLNITGETIDTVIATESVESRRLDKLYRGGAPHLKVVDKAVILVDDGISTFSSFRMAVTVLRLRRAAQIVIAVPIASAACVLELRATVNDVVTCTARTIPGELDAVGQWYEDFRQVPQESVRDLYERAKRSFDKVGTLELKPEHNRPANGHGGKR
jgi:putative phosphoribosyl transferase